MQEIQIKLDVFEGPLDLLLHLIQKLEIDIYDIPIAEVTDQYMQYIRTMKEFELSVAGEYLVMAATLMAIKSQTLLPVVDIEYEFEEDFFEEDPREALVNQLLEYRKYKYVAEKLAEKAEERSQYLTKDPMNVDQFKQEEEPILASNQLTKVDLFLAFHHMLETRKQNAPTQTTIATETATVNEKMEWIEHQIKQLRPNKGRTLTSLFTTYSKNEMVTTFLALLELMKNKKVHVEQKENYDEIMLYAVGEPNE